MLIKFRDLSPFISCILIILILSSTAYGYGYGPGKQRLYPTDERISIYKAISGILFVTAVLAGLVPWILVKTHDGSEASLRVFALGNGRSQPPTVNKEILRGNFNSAHLLVLGIIPYIICIQNFQAVIISKLAGNVVLTPINNKIYSALSAVVYKGQIYILAYNDQSNTIEMICGVPGSWTSLFTFTTPLGLVMGPFFGYPMWRFFPVDGGFVLLGEILTSNGPQLWFFRVNRSGQIQVQKVLHSDFEPNVAQAFYLAAALYVYGGLAYGAYIRRSDRCLILYTLNFLTGAFFAKPVFINHQLPQQLYTLRFLLSPIGLALLSMGPGTGGYIAYLSTIIRRSQTESTEIRQTSSTSGEGFGVRTRDLTEAGTFASPAVFALGLGENEKIDGKPYAQPWLFGGETASLGASVYALGFSPLNYPQFADGAGIFSELTFNNNDPDNAARVTVHFKDQQGQFINLDRNGNQITIPGSTVNGQVSLTIPPNGRRSLTSDSQGDVVVGSVTGYADQLVSGTTLFGGPIGLAGISNSPAVDGFTAQVDSITGEGINTGVAVMNVESTEITLNLQLCNTGGKVRANAQTTIPAMGQISLFVSQFDWDSTVNFDNFKGSIKATVVGGNAAAVVIQTRPNQIAPLEVTGN